VSSTQTVTILGQCSHTYSIQKKTSPRVFLYSYYEKNNQL